jgi:hypothetical protein
MQALVGPSLADGLEGLELLHFFCDFHGAGPLDWKKKKLNYRGTDQINPLL